MFDCLTGGFGTFHALCNSFIHFCMYIYYGVAALGPRYQKYLWWKKYMTSMQIVSHLSDCTDSLLSIVSGRVKFLLCGCKAAAPRQNIDFI